MPGPKKKSLDDLVTEAGNEVLGRNDSAAPPKSSMSEEELLATFGESEKKKIFSAYFYRPSEASSGGEQTVPGIRERFQAAKKRIWEWLLKPVF